MKPYLIPIVLCFLVLSSCKKEEVVYSDNDVPAYNEIPTVLVQNYVNRSYIDLLGREPFDEEMTAEVTLLEDASLSTQSRSNMITRLMTSDESAGADVTYKDVYYNKLYEDMKARFLEGASEGNLAYTYNLYYQLAIADSINGNLTLYVLFNQEAEKVLDVINSQAQLRDSEIEIDEMVRRMLFNAVYDDINMNSFNFINAAFDDLYFRFPTEAEFEASFNIIEYNFPDQLFGTTIQNKPQFVDVMIGNNEFDEGMIQWAYESLLSREATSNEVFELIGNFQDTRDFQRIQRSIMIQDEYAGFN
ncbi:MAG: hypothetical protein HRT74_05820 [Flavobacteriales bacterium]|nr:hypothetical protein [Flavobacteriales bacterium]